MKRLKNTFLVLTLLLPIAWAGNDQTSPLTQVSSALAAPAVDINTPQIDESRVQVFMEAKSRQTADLSKIPPFDPNFFENQSICKGNRTNQSKRIIYKWKHWYGVVNGTQDMGFYYSNAGKLFAVDYYIGDSYPKKIFGYSYPAGKLIATGVFAQLDTAYSFDLQGNFVAKVIGNNAFDAKGHVIGRRKIYFSQ